MLFNFPEVLFLGFFCLLVIWLPIIYTAANLGILRIPSVLNWMQSFLQDEIGWFWNQGVMLFQNIFRNNTCTHFQFLFHVNWCVARIWHGWSAVSCQLVLFHLMSFPPWKSWTSYNSSNTSNMSIWYIDSLTLFKSIAASWFTLLFFMLSQKYSHAL